MGLAHRFRSRGREPGCKLRQLDRGLEAPSKAQPAGGCHACSINCRARDLITDTQDSIITDTRDPITRHSTGRAQSGRTTITLPAIISLMTPTTAPPLKTWRRIVAGIHIILTVGHVGTELRRTSRVADAMCHLAASALCDCRVRPQCYDAALHFMNDGRELRSASLCLG